MDRVRAWQCYAWHRFGLVRAVLPFLAQPEATGRALGMPADFAGSWIAADRLSEAPDFRAMVVLGSSSVFEMPEEARVLAAGANSLLVVGRELEGSIALSSGMAEFAALS